MGTEQNEGAMRARPYIPQLTTLERTTMNRLLESDAARSELQSEMLELSIPHYGEKEAIYKRVNEMQTALIDEAHKLREERDAVLRCGLVWYAGDLLPHSDPDLAVFRRLKSEREAAAQVAAELGDEINREAAQDETLRFTESDTVVPTKAGAAAITGGQP